MIFNLFGLIALIFVAIGGVFNNRTIAMMQKDIERLGAAALSMNKSMALMEARNEKIINAGSEMGKALKEMLDELAAIKADALSKNK